MIVHASTLTLTVGTAASTALPPLPRHVAIVSFEGPDRYASVGGLATRVSSLARALARAGHAVTLFFVGDPAKAPVETWNDGVTLRRWCGWLSASHPRNAYDGEYAKVDDLTASLPSFIADTIVAPAQAAAERALVVFEEWQTANAAVALDRLLRERGLRAAATLLWNANNTYGTDRIDWPALTAAAAVTAVSRYMKFELAHAGIESLVVPNGIPAELLDGPDPKLVARVRSALGATPVLFKLGRFDPDKNWLQAIDALAELRADGIPARLIVRGGRDPYGEAVMGHARHRGLLVERLAYEGSDGERLIDALAATQAPVVHVRTFIDERTLFALYAGCDAVLANSGREPFGLVGLEVMAAGGVVVTGASGEEYAEPFGNALVCDTGDGFELATELRSLFDEPDLRVRIRDAGRATAARWTWTRALATLQRKVAFVESRTDHRHR